MLGVAELVEVQHRVSTYVYQRCKELGFPDVWVLSWSKCFKTKQTNTCTTHKSEIPPLQHAGHHCSAHPSHREPPPIWLERENITIGNHWRIERFSQIDPQTLWCLLCRLSAFELPGV